MANGFDATYAALEVVYSSTRSSLRCSRVADTGKPSSWLRVCSTGQETLGETTYRDTNTKIMRLERTAWGFRMDEPICPEMEEGEMASIRCIAQNLFVLARVSPNARVLVAGPRSSVVFNELRLRRCVRVVVTAARGTWTGDRYDIAIVLWHGMPLEGFDLTLNWVVRSIRRQGAVAIWIGRDEDKDGQKLRTMLDRIGFHIQVATACENGLAVVARRDELMSLALVA